jgi:hypothetical protein
MPCQSIAAYSPGGLLPVLFGRILGNMMENKGKYLKYGLHAAILIGLIWAAVKGVNFEASRAGHADF